MENYQIKKPDSIKKRKRVGCGPGSGSGKTCGRGMNGQRCRSGSTRRAWFEGGQMPLQRRVPKRGFSNYTRKTYQIVNLSQIEKLSENEINPEVLKSNGLIKKTDLKIKILGNGDITKAFKIEVDAFTKSAQEKVSKAGGEINIRKFPVKSEGK